MVASAPTLFNYEDLRKFECPIFFVNDTIRFSHYAKSSPTFFFTHHPPKFETLLINKPIIFFYPLTYIRQDEVVYSRKPKEPHKNRVYHNMIIWCRHKEWQDNESIKNFPPWCLDHEKIIEQNALLGHTGSITTLIHFLYFTGIRKAKMIGCNPHFVESHHHDERISEISGRKGSLWDLKAIIDNQTKFLNFFKITPEYLGDYEYWK